ncbi:MAG: iron-containing alcohol dehydrogenase [Clostridiales bacterium]|nr:iron-containing alcohol dehydrogenase [Clostridiales bacterium]
MEIHRMLSGANRYFQGRNILERAGTELAEHNWTKAYVVGGHKAMAAAWPAVRAGFKAKGIDYVCDYFTGFTTADEITNLQRKVTNSHCHVIVAIGGGKVLDLAKAAAELNRLPIVTIPTSAATCAAFAPISIVYNEYGRQVASRFHSSEVSAVFVDLEVIAAAPARLLAAGMADALAKSCEYSSARPHLRYGDIDTAKYCGFCLATAGDEIILTCGEEAYEDVLNNRITQAVEDAVFASIANIGIVSGICGYTNKPGGRFAIAHGFNEVIRGRWVQDPCKWLHGEIVSVGILAQLYVNQAPSKKIELVKQFYKNIHVPTTLKELGMELDHEEMLRFQEDILNNTSMAPSYFSRIREAILSVAG